MDNDPVIGLACWAGADGLGCPSNEALASWIDQGPSIPDRTAIARHLRRCSPCRLLVLRVIEIHLSEGVDPAEPVGDAEPGGSSWIEAARRAWSRLRQRFTALARHW